MIKHFNEYLNAITDIMLGEIRQNTDYSIQNILGTYNNLTHQLVIVPFIRPMSRSDKV